MINTFEASLPGWHRKTGLFVLFFVVEMMVFAIATLSPYVSMGALVPIHATLTAVLLIAALILRSSARGRPYWPVCAAFFVAAAAVLLSVHFSDKLLGLFGLTVETAQGIAVAKFSESLLRVVPILVLMPFMGFGWSSLYLKKGRIGIWLPVGIAAWIVFPIVAYLLMPTREGALDKLLPLAPWILLFVFSNALMEELLFRGLFLKPYGAFLGRTVSNILAAVVFTLMHTQVTYAPEMLQFLAIVLVLSLIWGYLIQKTDSLWGAVLFHAAGDCLVIFPIFAGM